MVFDGWLKQIKDGVVGETVRDYTDITTDGDKIRAQLRRQSKSFRFVLSLDHKEKGKADFTAPVGPKVLGVLRAIVDDIENATNNNFEYKDLRLRFRDGEIDLLITYNYGGDVVSTRQRTAPVSNRTVKLLEAMMSDAETLLSNNSFRDIDGVE